MFSTLKNCGKLSAWPSRISQPQVKSAIFLFPNSIQFSDANVASWSSSVEISKISQIVSPRITVSLDAAVLQPST